MLRQGRARAVRVAQYFAATPPIYTSGKDDADPDFERFRQERLTQMRQQLQHSRGLSSQQADKVVAEMEDVQRERRQRIIEGDRRLPLDQVVHTDEALGDAATGDWIPPEEIEELRQTIIKVNERFDPLLQQQQQQQQKQGPSTQTPLDGQNRPETAPRRRRLSKKEQKKIQEKTRELIRDLAEKRAQMMKEKAQLEDQAEAAMSAEEGEEEIAKVRAAMQEEQKLASSQARVSSDEVTPLVDVLAKLILRKGPISLGEFMSRCLQHPEFGYYATRDSITMDGEGGCGDFVTSPELSPLFGHLMAVWTMMQWRELGQPERLQVVELGPGSGVLMHDVLMAAKELDAEFFAAVKPTLVETSASLRRRQQETLGVAAQDYCAKNKLQAMQRFRKSMTTGNDDLMTIEFYQNLLHYQPSPMEILATRTNPNNKTDSEEYFAYAVGRSTLFGDKQVLWTSDLDLVPLLPTVYLANEFFDALPVHQFVCTGQGWREVVVDINPAKAEQIGLPSPEQKGSIRPQLKTDLFGDDPNYFVRALSPIPTPQSEMFERLLPTMRGQRRRHGAFGARLAVRVLKHGRGAVAEWCPLAMVIARKIALRVAAFDGAALFVDYGDERLPAQTFQGVREHKRHDPMSAPGRVDLTADVDFHSLAVACDSGAALRGRVHTHGVVTQSYLLQALGLNMRVKEAVEAMEIENDNKPLKERASTEQMQADVDSLVAAAQRLVHPDVLGVHFKAMALTRKSAPPLGFEKPVVSSTRNWRVGDSIALKRRTRFAYPENFDMKTIDATMEGVLANPLERSIAGLMPPL